MSSVLQSYQVKKVKIRMFFPSAKGAIKKIRCRRHRVEGFGEGHLSQSTRGSGEHQKLPPMEIGMGKLIYF